MISNRISFVVRINTEKTRERSRRAAVERASSHDIDRSDESHHVMVFSLPTWSSLFLSVVTIFLFLRRNSKTGVHLRALTFRWCPISINTLHTGSIMHLSKWCLSVMKKNASCHHAITSAGVSSNEHGYKDHLRLRYRRKTMHWQTIQALWVLLACLVEIDAYPEPEKMCSQKLVINGTHLVNNFPRQMLVMGISHLGCQACRNQAVR